MKGLAALVVALSFLAVSGCAQLPPEPREPADFSAFAADSPQDPSEALAESAAVPVRVRVPDLEVSSELVNLGIGADGRLEAPADYDLAGWFAEGVRPGAVGPAIIAGHIDSPTGPAIFERLDELMDGQHVLIDMSDGTELTFAVDGSIRSSKADFPTDAVYGNVPTPQVRLITCTGEFDATTGHYRDNLIVFASLDPSVHQEGHP